MEGEKAGTGRCPNGAQAARHRWRPVPARVRHRSRSRARTASRRWWCCSSARGHGHRGQHSRTRRLRPLASRPCRGTALRSPHGRLALRAASPESRRPGSTAARSNGTHGNPRLASQVVACRNYGEACTRFRAASRSNGSDTTQVCAAVPLIRVKWEQERVRCAAAVASGRTPRESRTSTAAAGRR